MVSCYHYVKNDKIDAGKDFTFRVIDVALRGCVIELLVFGEWQKLTTIERNALDVINRGKVDTFINEKHTDGERLEHVYFTFERLSISVVIRYDLNGIILACNVKIKRDGDPYSGYGVTYVHHNGEVIMIPDNSTEHVQIIGDE